MLPSRSAFPASVPPGRLQAPSLTACAGKGRSSELWFGWTLSRKSYVHITEGRELFRSRVPILRAALHCKSISKGSGFGKMTHSQPLGGFLC